MVRGGSSGGGPVTEGRRGVAGGLDVLVTLVVGGVCGVVSAGFTGVAALWAGLVGMVVVSFGNHVLLAWAARGSVGKLVAGLRVARIADGGRPSPLQLTGRWLAGYYWLAVLLPLHAATDSGLEGLDAVGVRVVRRGARLQQR